MFDLSALGSKPNKYRSDAYVVAFRIAATNGHDLGNFRLAGLKEYSLCSSCRRSVWILIDDEGYRTEGKAILKEMCTAPNRGR